MSVFKVVFKGKASYPTQEHLTSIFSRPQQPYHDTRTLRSSKRYCIYIYFYAKRQTMSLVTPTSSHEPHEPGTPHCPSYRTNRECISTATSAFPVPSPLES